MIGHIRNKHFNFRSRVFFDVFAFFLCFCLFFLSFWWMTFFRQIWLMTRLYARCCCKMWKICVRVHIMISFKHLLPSLFRDYRIKPVLCTSLHFYASFLWCTLNLSVALFFRFNFISLFFSFSYFAVFLSVHLMHLSLSPFQDFSHCAFPQRLHFFYFTLIVVKIFSFDDVFFWYTKT